MRSKNGERESCKAEARDVAEYNTRSDSHTSGSARSGRLPIRVCGKWGGSTMTLVSFGKVVAPALVVSSVVSYAFWDLARNRKIFGGTVPHTIQDGEWEKATEKKMDAWPREAAGPVVMNPISRQNYNKA